MFLISCPYCGPRDEQEFTYGGEGHIARPDASVDDETWGQYLYFRDNPKGTHYERWCHSFGCGAWFNIARDTVTHKITRVYSMLEPKSEPSE